MRVDFVITELFVGGAERCLTEVALGLAENGDQVRVFSLGRLPSGEQAPLVQKLQEANISVETGGANRSHQFLRASSKLKSWLRSSPPDICQTFLYHANVLGTLAAKSAGVTHSVGGLRVAEARSWRCWLERQAVRRMHSLVCVSKAVRRFADDHLDAGNKSIVIPNAVDVSRFGAARPCSWASIDWPVDSVVSVFVGRLHPQKGIELIRQQIDRLAPLNSNRRVLLIGDGPLKAQIANWASSVGSDRVKLLPWQRDVAPWIKAARLLLLPSHYEGMPNVVLEAMACGIPVVCSEVEGSEELLVQDRKRQGFPAGDGGQMAELADLFLNNESLANEIGTKNQEFVRSRFSVPMMVDAYRRHYRQVLQP